MLGSIRAITPESKGLDASLWFGLRGAGGNNFGIVTKLTFALEDSPPRTVFFDMHYNTPEECAQALLTYQQLGSLPATDPNSLSTLLSGELDVLAIPGDFCRLRGMYMGSLDDFNETLSTYTEALSSNGIYYDTSLSKVLAYDDYLGALSEAMQGFGGINATELHMYGYVRSLLDDGAYNLTPDSARAIMYSHAKAQPDDGSYVVQTEFALSGPASALSRPPRYGSMAFSHLNNIFISQMLSIPFPVQGTTAYWDGVSRMSSLLDAMKAAAGQGSTKVWYGYQNYMVSHLLL